MFYTKKQMEREVSRRTDQYLRERYEAEHRERMQTQIDKLTARVEGLEDALARFVVKEMLE